LPSTFLCRAFFDIRQNFYQVPKKVLSKKSFVNKIFVECFWLLLSVERPLSIFWNTR
jgi:hypothetical protein